MKEEKKEEKKERKDRYSIEEVPTQTDFFIKDEFDEKILDDRMVLLRILNHLEEIRRTMV